MRLVREVYSMLHRLDLARIMNNQSRHRHGGVPQYDLHRLDLSDRPILDFSFNLNHLGPPNIIRERWMSILEGIESYPSLDGSGVSQYYVHRYDVAPENVLAGNGSTELIYLLPRALGFKRAAVVSPSYNDYRRASSLNGAEVTLYELSPEDGFCGGDWDQLAKILLANEVLWIGNPNNPTGSLFSREAISDLARAFPHRKIIVDESFMSFVGDREERSFLRSPIRPNILVVHSLTKFYALAGIRLGGIIAQEDVIARLKKSKEPWTVNGLAERIAPLLLECKEYEDQSRALIMKENQRVYEEFKSLEGVLPFPPSANFMLCQWQRTDNLDDLLRHLLLNGLYVRDCRNFPGLGGNYFRTSIRSPEDNERLLSVISSFKT